MEQIAAQIPLWLQAVRIFFQMIEGIAWPLSILLIILVLRSHISDILPRVRKAGPAGIELDPLDQRMVVDSKPSEPSNSLKLLPGYARTNALAIQERFIHDQIKNLPEEQKDDINDILVLNLAQAQLEHHFALIYHQIFGSQIKALKHLDQSMASGVDYDHASMTFEKEVRSKYTELYKSHSFDDWAKFLLNQGLVEIKDKIFHITPLGEDFLRYLVQRKLPDEKFG